MTATRLVPLLALCLLGVPASAVTIAGRWTPDDNGYVSPPIDDLNAFRGYFADVLRLYDKYAPIADELAAGIESVGSLRLSPTSGEQENGFGADLDTGAIGFNPLATGGTTDIATGGDFIDKQLGSQKNNFEMAQVDVEKNVFKQEFGPVQGNRRMAPPGGDPGLEWYSFTFRAVDPTAPFPQQAFFASDLRTTLSVVPEPGAFVLTLLSLARVSRRR